MFKHRTMSHDSIVANRDDALNPDRSLNPDVPCMFNRAQAIRTNYMAGQKFCGVDTPRAVGQITNCKYCYMTHQVFWVMVLGLECNVYADTGNDTSVCRETPARALLSGAFETTPSSVCS